MIITHSVKDSQKCQFLYVVIVVLAFWIEVRTLSTREYLYQVCFCLILISAGIWVELPKDLVEKIDFSNTNQLKNDLKRFFTQDMYSTMDTQTN